MTRQARGVVRVQAGGRMALAFVVALAFSPFPARANESQSIWARETLGGDWGGARTWLEENGVGIRSELTGFYQGMPAGSGEGEFERGGRFDALIDLDTGKAGLWRGGGLHTHFEYRFGNLSAFRGGAAWPVSTGSVLPLGGKDDLVASSIYLSQRLGENTSLLLGKINAVDLLASDPFFGGWGIHRFMNIAFVAPPSGVLPPVIIGGILKHTFAPFSATLMVYDPDDQTKEYLPDGLFEDGVNVSLSAGWSGTLAGRATSLAVTGIYSTKNSADLSEALLPPELKSGEKDGSYSVSVQAGHLLWESPELPGKGLGLYLKAAIADGNPNPIRGSVVGGFAGHGMVPSRSRDTFGIGYFFYDFSDDLENAAEPLARYRDEEAVEIFYNLALTPWLRITADLQIIDPVTVASDTAVVTALRANVAF